MSKLTPKQEKFAQLYVSLGNASEAYRQSYDVDKSKPETVTENASRLLADSNVLARVEEIKGDTAKDHSVTRKDIVKMLFEIITDVDDTFDLAKLVDADKDERSRFFRMMQQTKNSDKLRALEQLTKMLGLNEPEQSKSEQQITINIKRDRDE
jgi:phage terminase small subunit